MAGRAAANAYRYHWNTYRLPHSRYAPQTAKEMPPPLPVVTYDKAERIKVHQEAWSDEKSIVHRLPEHFKRRYWAEWVLHDWTPVHYQPIKERWIWDEGRQVWQEQEEMPILPLYPPEADRGLWGGEGVVKGFYVAEPWVKKRTLPRKWVGKYWWPELQRALLRSEVLDATMSVIVTPRLLDLVDRHFGLDLYLLQTKDPDLHSALGRKLKREVALAIAEGLPALKDQPERQARLRRKYRAHKLPMREAEWIGLTLNEAAAKQSDAEDAERDICVPYKEALEIQTVEELRSGQGPSMTAKAKGVMDTASQLFNRLK